MCRQIFKYVYNQKNLFFNAKEIQNKIFTCLLKRQKKNSISIYYTLNVTRCLAFDIFVCILAAYFITQIYQRAPIVAIDAKGVTWADCICNRQTKLQKKKLKKNKICISGGCYTIMFRFYRPLQHRIQFKAKQQEVEESVSLHLQALFDISLVRRLLYL